MIENVLELNSSYGWFTSDDLGCSHNLSSRSKIFHMQSELTMFITTSNVSRWQQQIHAKFRPFSSGLCKQFRSINNVAACFAF